MVVERGVVPLRNESNENNDSFAMEGRNRQEMNFYSMYNHFHQTPFANSSMVDATVGIPPFEPCRISPTHVTIVIQGMNERTLSMVLWVSMVDTICS